MEDTHNFDLALADSVQDKMTLNVIHETALEELVLQFSKVRVFGKHPDGIVKNALVFFLLLYAPGFSGVFENILEILPCVGTEADITG